MADERFVSALSGAQMDDAFIEMNNRAPEGWTRGTKDGVPVPSTSPYFENNAKYYAELASENGEVEVLKAEGYAVGTQDGEEVPSTSPYYENNAKYFAEEAERQKDDAVNAAIAAIAPKKTVSNDPDNAVFDAVLNDAINAPVLSSLIKGKTVAWNQLVQNGNFSDGTTGWVAVNSTLSVSANTCTMTASAKNGSARQDLSLLVDHVYFISVNINLSTAASGIAIDFRDASAVRSIIVPAATGWQECTGIFTAREGTGNPYVRIIDARDSGWDAVQIKHVMVIDLTAAGYTAAETTDVTTFKAAFLRRMGYPLPQYIPYDAGSLKNVNGTFALCGRNLWDEEWEAGSLSASGEPIQSNSRIRSKDYISVSENKLYYARSNYSSIGSIWIEAFDVNKNIISDAFNSTYYLNVNNSIFTVPSGACFIKFVAVDTTYRNDICVNLSDPSFNGQYKPYYNGGVIDCSEAPLNGVGTAQDEVDFATGERTTRTGTGTLGDLNWTRSGDSPSGGNLFVTSGLSLRKIGRDKTITSHFPNDESATGPGLTKDGYCWSHSSTKNFYIRADAYSDAASFKAYLQSIDAKACYELETPVTSSITPQPLTTQDGYNLLRPTSGDVQSAEVTATYSETVEGYVNEKIAEVQALVLENINA